jgi:hypothetical protein
VHELIIGLKKAYNAVGKKVLFNVLIHFGISKKLVGLINMQLNETYNTVLTARKLSDKFPIENGLKHGDSFITIAF